MEPLYLRIAAQVLARPWAVTPEIMAVMVDIMALRMSGERLTRQEIEARVDAAKPAPVRRARANNVAIVPIHGMLTHRADLFSDVSGMTSLERVRSEIDEAAAEKAVDTIMLHIDSPGGSTDGVAETAAMVRDVRQAKPVVAVADTMAASAAYWIGSQASELVVTPSGTVGSIGIYTVHQDLHRALEQAGIDTTIVFKGERKIEGNPTEPLSPDAKAALQETVDEFYDMFVSDVALGRGVSVDAVLGTYGQGRGVTARRALAAGMVDAVEPFAATLARWRAAKDPPRSRPSTPRRSSKARLSAGLLRSSLPR